MLTIFGDGGAFDCEGQTRRDFLRIGTLGLAGLSLPQLFAARAQAAQAGKHLRDRSVIFLFLRGGATHIETWDPKMTAPAEYRSMFGEVKTRLPGVTFGGTFPKLAALADRLAVVRSFRVGSGNHGTGRQLISTGDNPLKAPMGAVYSRLAGSTSPKSGIPNHAVLLPNAMGPEYRTLTSRANELQNVGSLPAEYKAFFPSAGGEAPAKGKGNKKRKNRKAAPKGGGLLEDMKLRLDPRRLDDRRGLLEQLDAFKHGLDKGGAEGLDKFQQQAFDVILGGVGEAFDLEKEDPRTLARYDTARFAPPEKATRKGTKNAVKIPGFSPVALGKQMLLARRLCEAGCGFVTVVSEGWDMHGNAFGVNDGMPCLGGALDHTVSAFLDDVKERGLSDKILLVITGEMGRTPKINKKGGRDHWANLCSLALAGGGLKTGQVIGASDRRASSPATEPVTVRHLLTTLLHSLFNVGELRVMRGLPTEVVRLATNGQPIRQLFS
jgi:uncharacterized protein (DUF1501 family)